ncbi:MAG: 4Fe-4S dicluster domain-containing protein [Thermodesulfobacteriota bacterium]|nr:4Fe-4S dicluster domain-containing protein [Thermodesulfobacteriota bacterium]
MKQTKKSKYVKALENKKGWGVENVPFPKEVALIETRWDLCIGCGFCEVACSMFHHGVINRELSRIRIYRYLLPAPKSVQNVCCQCSDKERECEKACPVDPPVIRYDHEKFHMVVDEERCLGAKCSKCLKACPAKVPRFYSPEHNYAMVCDLCEKDGNRRPQCVEICPSFALEYMKPQFPQHLQRIDPDEKAECLTERLQPLSRDKVQIRPEELFGGENG